MTIVLMNEDTQEKYAVREDMYYAKDEVRGDTICVGLTIKDVAQYLIDHGALNDLTSKAIERAQKKLGANWVEKICEDAYDFNEVFEDVYLISCAKLVQPLWWQKRIVSAY